MMLLKSPRPGRRNVSIEATGRTGNLDGCHVDGERVRAQPGNFYGGWITADVVGPFKGEPGSRGW